MSSAPFDLSSRIRLLEFVAKAPEFFWSDILHCLGLIAAKNRGILRYLNIDGEGFEPVPAGARVDEREKLTCVVSVSHNISLDGGLHFGRCKGGLSPFSAAETPLELTIERDSQGRRL